MLIKNASVFIQGETGEHFEEKDIYIAGEYFAENMHYMEQVQDTEMLPNEETLDGENCFAIPGLTDIHFHGCAGRDFSDGTVDAIDRIATYEASVGVTTIVPAVMTLDEKRLTEICEAAATYYKEQNKGTKKKKAVFCGINLEGPFLSASKCGAQNPEYIQKPNQALFDKLQQKSNNLIKLMSIAPETEGAMDFIRVNCEKVIISLAHTIADYATSMAAFEAGASHVTHLYNAMPGFEHRTPGVVGATADSGAEAELICDGLHVHPSVIRTTLKMLGTDKVIFISDSMMAAGLEDGNYQLGDLPVHVSGHLATLQDGTLAGSATNLMDCMRKAVLDMGIPLEIAVKCAAVNSAKSVGIYDKYGSITPGKVANLVLLNKKDLSLNKVILKGQIL